MGWATGAGRVSRSRRQNPGDRLPISVAIGCQFPSLLCPFYSLLFYLYLSFFVPLEASSSKARSIAAAHTSSKSSPAKGMNALNTKAKTATTRWCSAWEVRQTGRALAGFDLALPKGTHTDLTMNRHRAIKQQSEIGPFSQSVLDAGFAPLPGLIQLL